MMTREEKKELKIRCRKYMYGYSLAMLRCYGRDIGVAQPTKLNKKVLIEHILEIHCGERTPLPYVSPRGAPVKYEYVDPELLDFISREFKFDTAKRRTVNLPYEEEEEDDPLTKRFKELPLEHKEMLMHLLDAILYMKRI